MRALNKGLSCDDLFTFDNNWSHSTWTFQWINNSKSKRKQHDIRSIGLVNIYSQEASIQLHQYKSKNPKPNVTRFIDSFNLYRLWCRNARKYSKICRIPENQQSADRIRHSITKRNSIAHQMKTKTVTREALWFLSHEKQTERKHPIITNADRSKSWIPIINKHLRSVYSKHMRGLM